MSDLGEDVMSKQEIDMQATGGKNVKEVNLFNVEVDDKAGQDKVLVGPDSGDKKLYDYLTRKAAKLNQQFAHTIKGCVHSEDILVDRNLLGNSKVVI